MWNIILIALISMVICYFFGTDASLAANEKMLSFCIVLGFIITILSPFIGLYQFLRNLVMRVIRLFRSKERSKS